MKDVEELHWVIGWRRSIFWQLKQRYYARGPPSKYMRFKKEPARVSAKLESPWLLPNVALDVL
jgi:hypothetical protein